MATAAMMGMGDTYRDGDDGGDCGVDCHTGFAHHSLRCHGTYPSCYYGNLLSPQRLFDWCIGRHQDLDSQHLENASYQLYQQ